MKYLRILASFFGQPWALDADKFNAVARLLDLKARGGDVDREAIDAAVASRRANAVGYQLIGRTAVIPIMGVIAHRVGAIEEASGGIGTDAIGRAVDAAVADSQVQRILLQIDSPGGSVFGIQELAAKIRGARSDKEVIAIADPVAASAAYWIGAQATRLFMTPSGLVGSIGVIAEHADHSQADEREGIRRTLVTAGRRKAEGHPSRPLDDEAVASLQAKVDYHYTQMIADIATGRGVPESTVRGLFGEGAAYTADVAARVGMIDGVATVETLLRQFDTGGRRAATLAATTPADVVRATARTVEIDT